MAWKTPPIPITSEVVEKASQLKVKVQSNKKETKMRIKRLMQFLVALGAIFAVMVSSASAAWTHLGGDPLFPGGIKGSGQTARNDFVKKSRNVTFSTAMKYAGLNKRERTAVKSYIVRGKFTNCMLHYGDHFVQESYGTNGTSVDRNVTFLDPRYKDHGAPAFCLNVKVTLGKGGSYEIVKIKVPFICVNFGVMSKQKHKAKAKKPAVNKPATNNVIPAQNVPTTQTQATSGQGNCNSVNSGNLAGPGSVQGACNNVVVVCNGAGSCSPQTTQTNTTYQWCVDNGGTWDSEKNLCTMIVVENPPPPICTSNCTPTTPTCEAGSTWSVQNQKCEKSGTTTPPTPTQAPGTNPTPSPQDPTPGGHACYDANDPTKTVEPILIGGIYLCPAGSYGTP